MIQIVDANPFEPVKVLIYGPEGMGKSTFGAMSDDPIMMPLEPGASRLKDKNGRPVKLMKGITNYDDVLAGIKYLRNERHSFKTFVLDSASALERIATRKVLENTKKSLKTIDGGYGAGAARLAEMHTELIAQVEDLRIQRDMNIVVTAHSAVKTVKDPSSMHDYDEYELALDKGVANVWKQYVDALFFVRLTTFSKETETTDRARAFTDNTITAFTRKDPAFQAKNRFGMPKQMPFTLDFWDVFMGYAKEGAVEGDPETAPEDLVKEQVEISTRQSEIMKMIGQINDTELQGKMMRYLETNGKSLKDLDAIAARIQDNIAKQTA